MKPTKVLQVHNRYQTQGGEEAVVEAEASLLRANGDVVVQYTADNHEIQDTSTVELAIRTIWSRRDHQNITREIDRSKPDLVHVHNTFPLISPSIYYAAASRRLPVVQTLHNYRFACPAGTLFRDGEICSLCAFRSVPWPAVRFKCYRGSRVASAGVATMLTTHRIARTYKEMIDAYIALTPFSADKFVEFGFPRERIYIKPNFLSTDHIMPPVANREDFVLFVGRLSKEKGISTLLRAWDGATPLPRLVIVGDGPLRGDVEGASLDNSSIDYLGWRAKAEVFNLMTRAQALVFPSEWYEGFPMTLVEAFANGLPVIASDIGSLKSIVHDGDLGRRFSPGDHEALRKVTSTLLEDQAGVAKMRESVLREFQAKYSLARNYDLLRQVYDSAISSARDRYGRAHA